MITVCIFELRNAMCTVQKNFEINSLGTKHALPDLSKEIAHLSVALQDNKKQSYTEGREANEHIQPVRDLLGEGSKYPDTCGAFHTFKKDNRVVENLGQVDPAVGDTGEAQDNAILDQQGTEDYEVTPEDLAIDDEEPYGGMDSIMSFINEMDEY